MNEWRGLVVALCFGLLAACGGDDSPASDPDAAPGGSADAAPDNSCGIVFRAPSDSSPDDTPVAFLGPDDTVLLESTLDASGQATHSPCPTNTTIAVGLSVTVGPNTGFEAFVFLNVQPGQTVRYEFPSTDAITDSATVTPAPSTEALVVANVSCASGSVIPDALLTINEPISAECLDSAGNLNLLAAELEGEVPTSFDWALDVAPVSGGTTEFGTLPGWSNSVTRMVSLSDIPVGADNVRLATMAERQGRSYFYQSENLPVAGTTSMTSFEMPGDGFTTSTLFESHIDYPLSITQLVTWEDAMSTTLSHASSQHLPPVSDSTVIREDGAPINVAWTGDFSTTDLGIVRLSWNPEPMVAKGILIAFPASEQTGPLVVPELPASLSEFTPDSDDTVGSSVRFLDASERSYAQMLSDGTFRFQTGAREFAIAGETTRSAQQTFIVASP